LKSIGYEDSERVIRRTSVDGTVRASTHVFGWSNDVGSAKGMEIATANYP
jgi:hypothetical protein